MAKEKLTPEEKKDLRKGRTSFNDLVRRARSKGALLELNDSSIHPDWGGEGAESAEELELDAETGAMADRC